MLEIHSDKVDEPNFTMKIISTNKNNLGRYAGEGLNIEKQVGELSINKKAEWCKD